MKIKVSEATELQLDWLVAKCEEPIGGYKAWVQANLDKGIIPAGCRYSTDWLAAGEIIERELLDVCIHIPTHQWCSATQSSADKFARGYGPTPLVAAMRCYVASKLGDEVEIPEELK